MRRGGQESTRQRGITRLHSFRQQRSRAVGEARVVGIQENDTVQLMCDSHRDGESRDGLALVNTEAVQTGPQEIRYVHTYMYMH